MKAKDLRDMDDKKLREQLDELMQQQFMLRMQIATGQQNNHASLRTTRRDIARVRTIMNEKAGNAS